MLKILFVDPALLLVVIGKGRNIFLLRNRLRRILFEDSDLTFLPFFHSGNTPKMLGQIHPVEALRRIFMNQPTC